MEIVITLKDPDGVYESIRQDVEASLPEDLSERERDALAKVRQEEVSEAVSAWVKYGEYVTIKIDTKAGTAEVVKQ